MPAPPKGSMYLYDYIQPPLKPDSYRMHVSTDVKIGKNTQQLDDDKYFEVVGPRFTLPPTEVAGVFPPRNGHGPFQDSLPQVVIKRRTLPWERTFDSKNKLPAPVAPALPDSYPTPWLALLLFEEGEYDLLQGVPLDKVVSADCFNRLGKPANVLCDAVEAELDLVKAIMPSREELKLLAHARRVNIDDRELNVEGSDGWFSVVVGNRVPSPGAKCRCCLVSVEERTDLVAAEPPPTYLPSAPAPVMNVEVRDFGRMASKPYMMIEAPQQLGFGSNYRVVAKTRLVLLHSWQFACTGIGTFYNLMQKLDVAMIGAVQKPGKPALTDTAHMKLTLQDRGGTEETALYRGPLVPFELTRDPLGPYHSADQARRATPEAGVEDISYAAAFEVGRLLAAADARLAQELMRWRRESYKQSARADGLVAIQAAIQLQMPLELEAQLYTVLPPVLAAAAMGSLVKGVGPVADPYGIKIAAKAVGMDPAAVSAAFGLASVLEAQTVLGMTPGTLGIEVPAVAQTPRDNATLDSVVADVGGLQRLNNARTRIIENVMVKLGGTK
jgi:hypothetical protein